MYERVVVPYDGSQRSLAALDPGQRLARAWRCELEVVHVAGAGEPGPSTTEVGRQVRLITGDDPARTLIGAVSDPSQLLCMATRGRGALGKVLFGSVTAAVLRGLHAPLVVAGPQLLAPVTPDALRRLLVCLDGSTMSATILPVARQWAEELDLAVRLVHVAYPPGDPLGGPTSLPEETRAATAEVERTAADLVDAGIDADWRVVEDTDTATGIVRHAAHRSVDLIAMTTHGRTGLDRVLIGSVTTDVVRRAPVPVLTLRPERLG